MSNETSNGVLGAQLRARRRALGVSQTEVAELAGTTQRSVSQVETGKAGTLALYLAVAEVLGLDVVARPRAAGPDDVSRS